jgi:AraC-like DNA-binding protein
MAIAKRTLLVWIVPAALAVAGGWALRITRLDLLEPTRERYSFTDQASGGGSTVWSLPGRPWRFGWNLRPGFAFPYAAAGLRLFPDSQQLDASVYQELVVEWRARHPGSLRLLLNTFEPGTTRPGEGLSYVPLEGALPISNGWSRQSLDLHALQVPLWWNQVAHQPLKPRPEALRRLETINLQNGMDSPLGEEDTVEVRLLELRGTTWKPLGLLLLGAMLLSTSLWWRLARRHAAPEPGSASQAPPAVPVQDVALGSRRDEETRRLLEWIGAHYMDPDLTVEIAARQVGVAVRRIPSLLREAGFGSFPAFVNGLRMAQAKRLLRETDRTASEIAAAVGVSSVPHFHRLFKAETGMTPLDWRSAPEDPKRGGSADRDQGGSAA